MEECPTPTKTPVESNATNAAKNETKEAPPKADAEEEEKSPKADAETDEDKNDTIPIFVQCLSGAQFKLTVAPTETVMEIRQIISESVEGCYVTSFNLVVEVDGSTVVLDDYAGPFSAFSFVSMQVRIARGSVRANSRRLVLPASCLFLRNTGATHQS